MGLQHSGVNDIQLKLLSADSAPHLGISIFLGKWQADVDILYALQVTAQICIICSLTGSIEALWHGVVPAILA